MSIRDTILSLAEGEGAAPATFVSLVMNAHRLTERQAGDAIAPLFDEHLIELSGSFHIRRVVLAPKNDFGSSAARSELEDFTDLLDQMGCPRSDVDSRDEQLNCVSVSQAHFYFDKDGNFVEIRDDEMGGVGKRRKV